MQQCWTLLYYFFVGKKTGMNVSQIYPEDGNMGKVLPKYLTEWTTNKVRKGKLLQIFSVLCCEYEDLFLIVTFYA